MIRYLFEITTADETINISSSCRDPLNPSDIRYPDGLGGFVSYPVRLDGPPSVNQKISDSISGTIISNQYSIGIMNDDGLYDDLDQRKIFGARCVLKRSDKEGATLDDFDIINTGIVDYLTISDKKVVLYINSVYRSLTEEVCRVFTTDDYPNLPDDNIDKKIPVGYGPGLKNVPLFKIDSTDESKLIALDPYYIISVSSVYDSDGNSVAFTGPDSNGIITAAGGETADVSGLLNNRIGEMIIYETLNKSGIDYDSTNWELYESDIYKGTSAKLNYYFTGGTVRSFVDGVLKNDNAFFFTKNNGLLTMRQWGIVYNILPVPSWMITKFDKKDFKDASKYFNSSVIIEYGKDISAGKYDNQYIDATEESAIIDEYGKQKRVPYKTDLYQEPDIEDLASRLVSRFGTMSPNVKVGIGISTANVDLLDTIKLSVTINSRKYSDDLYWITRESNPGQDVLLLEALSGFEEPDVIQGVLSQPKSEETGSGILSEPISEDRDGVLSQPSKVND